MIGFGLPGRHLTGLNHMWLYDSRRLSLATASPLKKISLLESFKGWSVLGPPLLILYTPSVSSIISGHAIPHHLYSDDSQLYVSFAAGDSAAALNGLQSCLVSVQSWMSMNKLKLNPDKSEFLLIGNERQRSKYLSMFPVEVFDVETNPTKSARNLGVIFDQNFTFYSHISAFCCLPGSTVYSPLTSSKKSKITSKRCGV